MCLLDTQMTDLKVSNTWAILMGRVMMDSANGFSVSAYTQDAYGSKQARQAGTPHRHRTQERALPGAGLFIGFASATCVTRGARASTGKSYRYVHASLCSACQGSPWTGCSLHVRTADRQPACRYAHDNPGLCLRTSTCVSNQCIYKNKIARE